MKQITKLEWDGNTVKVENSSGSHTKTHKDMSMEMWRFKVLGEVPKGKSVKRTISKYPFSH